MTLLILYAAIALGFSFLCSLLEASLLSLPRSHIESLVAQGSAAGRRMKALKESIDRPLAAILTVNTVAHTVGAAGVGAQAAVTFGDTAVGVASAVMTLLILLLSEIVPKTLGAVHAGNLVGFTAVTVGLLVAICLPIVIPLEWLNRRMSGVQHRDRISRLEVLATIQLGHEGGVLHEREHRIVTNLMALETVRVADILTPRTVVFALPADQTIGTAAAATPPMRFSRIPIYGKSIEDVVGYVTRHDIMDAAAQGRGAEALETLKRPILVLPELASVADALEQLLHQEAHIALVVEEHGGTAGIVALEDVLETLLGQEITDETDPAVDMQHVARRLAAFRANRSQSDT